MDLDLILGDMDLEEEEIDLDLDDTEEFLDFDFEETIVNNPELTIQAIGDKVDYPCIIIKNMNSLEEFRVKYGDKTGSIPVMVEIEGVYKEFARVSENYESILSLLQVKQYDMIYYESEDLTQIIDEKFLESRFFL